ncbi:trimeric intracellular cation channel family protein [Spirosoma luteum]|uniref:trimeric intracellular cation channel family protein n=1 Tax=Spirosoma luteum TaxID=431553 RepID=UPI000378663D|nr:trimeric intracellular cation channel family protein [Spirosoma luteum]
MIDLPQFTIVIDYLGTFAFAISGIRAAGGKDFDLFGAYVIGLVTATGGGTLRDILLGVRPFWMTQPSYLIITGVALLASLLFSSTFRYLSKAFFLFDAVGLGLFVVVGIEKTLAAGFPFWVAITMGMITGSVGGVIRDVLVNEVPLLFRRDIYALACVAGGIAYALCFHLHVSLSFTKIIAASVVIVIRVLAVRYRIRLPAFEKGRGELQK